jgi:hypothetical protein
VANATADELENSVSELVTALNSAAEDVRAVGEEYGEAADNMEQAFPNGSSVIDEIREKGETCETWADNLDTCVSTLEGLDVDIECTACGGTGQIECDSDEDGSDVTSDGSGMCDCEECNGEGNTLGELKEQIQEAVDEAMSERLD